MINDDKLVDTDFNKVIGIVLKEKREEKNLSLSELSRKLKNEVSRQTLSNYETAATKIRRNMFIKLCNFYHITPDELLNEITIRYMKFRGE